MEKHELARSELKKHVGAIHIRNRLTLLQQKMANVLLLNAYENMLSDERHRISLKRLSELVGFHSNDIDVIKDALRSLTQTSIEWNLLDERGRDVWRVSSMLAEAEISRGECVYAYSRMLREKLYNPEIYARINLAIQRRFSSGHALALYENCARFRSVRATGWWDLELFRKLMGIEEKEYKQFKDLHKRVIKPAVTQVNAQSDIFLTVEFQRDKRRVVALRFLVEDNPQIMLRLSVKDQLIEEIEGNLVSGARGDTRLEGDASSAAVDPTSDQLHGRLLAFGLTEKTARNWIAKSTPEYIMGNLDVVDNHLRAGRVSNLPAFTVAALKDDYRPKRTADRSSKPTERKSTANKDVLLRKDALETLELLHNDFRRRCLKKALDVLDASTRKALMEEFIAEHRGNPLIRKFRKQGLDHPVILSVFLANYGERLLSESHQENEREEFVRFVTDEGHDLKQLMSRAGLREDDLAGLSGAPP